MSDSIIEASRKSRTRGFFGFFKKKIVIAVLLLLAIGAGTWYYFDSEKAVDTSGVKKQEQAVASKGDVKISIESDGKVVAEDGVDLSFSVSGDTLEVSNVYVKVGDKVKRGDKIATVKADSLEMNVRTAYANYQSVLASYEEKLDGATEANLNKAKNAIDQAELSLDQAEESLVRAKVSAQDAVEKAQDQIDTAKKNLDYDFKVDYQDSIDKANKDLVSVLKSTVISIESMLKDSDEIIGVDDKYLNDAFESNLGVKDVNTLSSAVGSYAKAKQSYQSLNSSILSLSETSSADTIDMVAKEASACMLLFEEHFYKMQLMLASSITSSVLTQATLDSFKSGVNSNRAAVNSKISSLDTSIKAVSDANKKLNDYKNDYNDSVADLKKIYDDAVKNLQKVKDDNENNIKDVERNITTKKLSLKEAKDNLEELQKPISDAELASAKSQLTSSSVSLERAQSELESATLVSPIDGEVNVVNFKAGDTIIKTDAKIVASIINKDTMFVEVNIEEAEINKLKVGQKSVATFDALDGLETEGEISFISLTSETSNNGIVTYLVRVLFENPKDSNIREGMTASVEFLTAGVTDVVYVPVDAVRNVEGKPSVQLSSGEWAVVSTGFTDGENVEIISGLKVGDRVVY